MSTLDETLAQLRACLVKRKARGEDGDEAEELCRGGDAATPIGPLPKRSESKKTEASPISSPIGPGIRPDSGYLGTGAVVYPDPVKAAKDWAKGAKVEPTRKGEWGEYAKRIGLDPERAEAGWASLMNTKESAEAAALATLAKVFGETTSWAGYWVPHPGLMKMHQAPQIGNARGAAIDANPPDEGGFSFSTMAAKAVWQEAQKLILLEPLLKPAELLAQAIAKTGTLATELTPEDEQLLRIAIDWLQNGPARSSVRIGGTPGGPARSGDSNRGAP